MSKVTIDDFRLEVIQKIEEWIEKHPELNYYNQFANIGNKTRFIFCHAISKSLIPETDGSMNKLKELIVSIVPIIKNIEIININDSHIILLTDVEFPMKIMEMTMLDNCSTIVSKMEFDIIRIMEYCSTLNNIKKDCKPYEQI